MRGSRKLSIPMQICCVDALQGVKPCNTLEGCQPFDDTKGGTMLDESSRSEGRIRPFLKDEMAIAQSLPGDS